MLKFNMYEKDPNILDKICAIRDFIKKEKLDKSKKPVLSLAYYYKNVRILFNENESPDKAKGMFLLLPRNLLKMKVPGKFYFLVYCGDDRDIKDVINSNNKEFESMYSEKRRRLQEKFEFFTYKRLCEYFPNKIYQTPYKCNNIKYDINDCDFIINCEKGIEVKSDQFWYTGNISLELLRDYRVDNCDTNKSNIGSILKTKADIWQEYFYCKNNKDNEKYIFITEIYDVEKLQEYTSIFIDLFYKKFINNIK
jgi:hypothetical protein